MKMALIFFISIILISCTEDTNHSHDGKYITEEFETITGTLDLKGNEIDLVIPNTLSDGNFEIRTKCKQYADRIEFEEKGTAFIGRFDRSGNLDLMGFLFKKIDPNELPKKKEIQKPKEKIKVLKPPKIKK